MAVADRAMQGARPLAEIILTYWIENNVSSMGFMLEILPSYELIIHSLASRIVPFMGDPLLLTQIIWYNNTTK